MFLEIKWKKFKTLIKWLLFDFTGILFILGKIRPPFITPFDKNRKPPSTIFLWILGIYIALFGVASQRFEYKLDMIENRINILLNLLGEDKTRKNALSEIPNIQNVGCPEKPEILNPFMTIRSIFGKTKLHKESIDNLKRIVVNHKEYLYEAHFVGIDLSGTDLSKANFREADLLGADLSRASLFAANLSGANLVLTKLFGSNMRRANLSGANLINAKMKYADMSGADLRGVKNIEITQLCTTRTLYEAILDPELEKQIKDKCPYRLVK